MYIDNSRNEATQHSSQTRRCTACCLSLALLLTVMMGASCASVPSAETSPQSVTVNNPNQTGGPRELVRKLQHIGVPDSLNGRGWSPSKSGDGRWIAILVKDFPIDQLAENEVSCWFESTKMNEIHHLELNAEIYHPRYYRDEVMDLFERAVREVYPNAPQSLMQAIRRKRAWSAGGWEFKKIEYDNSSNGYQLMLTWSQ